MSVIEIIMYKQLISLLICCGLFSGSFAQEGKPGIAPFKIRLVNDEGFTYQQLKKGKPVILVYFSPTCDHCKLFTAAMLKRQETLNEKQIVLISFEDLGEVRKFDDLFNLSSHPNIKIGSEGYTFVVQRFYRVEHFPFVAEYNKEGKLEKILSQKLKPEEMAAQL